MDFRNYIPPKNPYSIPGINILNPWSQSSINMNPGINNGSFNNMGVIRRSEGIGGCHIKSDEHSQRRRSCLSCRSLINQNYMDHLSIFYELIRCTEDRILPPYYDDITGTDAFLNSSRSRNGIEIKMINKYSPRGTRNQSSHFGSDPTPGRNENVGVGSVSRYKKVDKYTSTAHDIGLSVGQNEGNSYQFGQGMSREPDTINQLFSKPTAIDFDNPDRYVKSILEHLDPEDGWNTDNNPSIPPVMISETREIHKTDFQYPPISITQFGTWPYYPSYYLPPPLKNEIRDSGQVGKKGKNTEGKKKAKSKQKRVGRKKNKKRRSKGADNDESLEESETSEDESGDGSTSESEDRFKAKKKVKAAEKKLLKNEPSDADQGKGVSQDKLTTPDISSKSSLDAIDKDGFYNFSKAEDTTPAKNEPKLSKLPQTAPPISSKRDTSLPKTNDKNGIKNKIGREGKIPLSACKTVPKDSSSTDLIDLKPKDTTSGPVDRVASSKTQKDEAIPSKDSESETKHPKSPKADASGTSVGDLSSQTNLSAKGPPETDVHKNPSAKSISKETPSIIVSGPSTTDLRNLEGSLNSQPVMAPKVINTPKVEGSKGTNVFAPKTISNDIKVTTPQARVKEVQTKFQLPNHPTLTSREKLDIMGKAVEIGNKNGIKGITNKGIPIPSASTKGV